MKPKITQNTKTQSTMTKKTDDKIAELEKENQKLKEENISQMFHSIIQLIKTENEKVLGKIELLTEKHNTVNQRQILLEEKVIPEIRNQIEHLKTRKNECPVTTGHVKKDHDLLVDRVELLEKETAVARYIAKYPKLLWSFITLICTLGSSAGIYYFIEKFFISK